MICTTIDIQTDYTKEPGKLDTYLLDLPEKFENRTRPLVLICPGGAYAYTSPREGEPVAAVMNGMGYHAAVLRYSCAPARFPAALTELAQSVFLFRKKAADWHIDPSAIFVLGFSAGGHLAASLGAFWDSELLSGSMGLAAESIRPDGLILGYPVITSGRYANRSSITNLLGGEKEKDPGLRELVSLEYHVTSSFPRTFLWGTFDDASVPVQNSLLLVKALAEKKIPCEYHLFEHGVHGLALGDWRTESSTAKEVSSAVPEWIPLVQKWIERGWRKNG